jgi:RNA polymerase sigma-70 factor (ECF subfamily)
MSLASGPEMGTPFIEVVENVRSGHPEGLDQLYRVFCILSASLRLRVGFRDFDDRMHDIFLVVVEAIRDGKLREPGALSSYIHGIALRSLWTDITLRKRRERLSDSLRQWVVSNQHSPNPEEVLTVREQDQTIGDLLGTLSSREREILIRFYLYEQPKEKICQELDLTETQFRLTKSRATQRLRAIGEKRHSRKCLSLNRKRRRPGGRGVV